MESNAEAVKAVVDPHRPRWFMPWRLWREASPGQRLKATLPPLIAPALFFFEPRGAAMLGGGIILVCALVFVFRLLLQPFRLGQPARLKAWRAPAALAGAIATMVLFNAASNQARTEARDLALGLQGGLVEWPCGDEDRCAVTAGFDWAQFLVHVSRDSGALEPTQTVFFYRHPDASTTFVATPREIRAHDRVDEHIYELDVQTLLRLPNA